ncbi:MAG: 2-succinyl-5-enolpyruvyl-6-hydroxy-3-cyclohexene-1-carboxylic-acid synthase [Propionicimonas sp.]|nr:2-succinyl-5-enolpyruvyl-6-hydroxy-3-cyclohexene-1-carboxylic-acid synthase [Propionicimonas sp.]
MSRSYACAEAVVATLLAGGVTDLVLAPGSRSAPLALAAHAAQAAGRLRLHVRVDERSAGFLALGLAKVSGRVVPVVTTSGTAVGNLLPAVMEAHHSRVSLLVVSADRPADLVGTGANQTTVQPGIFGVFVRGERAVDAADRPMTWAETVTAAVSTASGGQNGYPGPVHLNLALPEPLVPDDPEGDWGRKRLQLEVPEPAVEAGFEPVVLDAAPPTVVVAGDASPSEGARARAFAEAAGLPLLAEPSSNARGGTNALRCGRLLLGTELADQVQRVVMFGHPTLSRPVTRLLTRTDVELVVVGSGPDLPNPGRHATLTAKAVTSAPNTAQQPRWLAAWLAADQACGRRLDGLLAGLSYVSGPAVAEAVVRGTGEGILALGNSMAIRDADLAPILTKPATVYANRGLSGIDGTVSTAVGLSLGSGWPVTLLCGDLSFVHDINGLAIGPGEPRPALRVVVADDAGGAIFTTLEYGQARFADSFERVFATPTGIDPVTLASAYGVPARRLGGLVELRDALAVPVRGLEVLVVGVDRAQRRELSDAVAHCVDG